MLIVSLISGIILAYLIGSIPSSVWVGRYFYGVDVRNQGSGNAGATNTLRVLGARAGIPVLVIDILKGFLAVEMAGWFDSGSLSPDGLVHYRILLATVTTLGHIFPIYIGFRGGKGVATLVGVILALLPASLLVSLGVFLLVFLLFHYVSLASIIAALSFPFIVSFIFRVDEPSLILFSVMVALFIPLTHLKNIRRLLLGSESKFTLKRK